MVNAERLGLIGTATTARCPRIAVNKFLFRFDRLFVLGSIRVIFVAFMRIRSLFEMARSADFSSMNCRRSTAAFRSA